ncbi:MAG TPA: DNA (cytosine-5-)-methyltransferase [Stellaceae bacterium]|nr:DNA (cytosine-5-)-methyltransferase [Stellaceae bacterium]
MLRERLGSARGTDTPWYRGWNLTAEERAVFRATTLASQAAKRRALSGECDQPKHPINCPRLDINFLMPQRPPNGIRALSLFSGGGGFDIGFERAGFSHLASYEILEDAAEILKAARPEWSVFGGREGDVTGADWSQYHAKVDVLHGGPPCQPFSHAGRRNGADDVRDMVPEFVRAVKCTEPRSFVFENVLGLKTRQFETYIRHSIIGPLSKSYKIHTFSLDAADYGLPQRRRRVFFVGFRDPAISDVFFPPLPTHCQAEFSGKLRDWSLPRTMGVREALGLPDIGFDAVAPTIRSGLTGPRHTTSILNSVSALKVWDQLRIWPNGVALTRESAKAYVVNNGHFRLSVPDCMVIQGFPGDWPIGAPVYFALGLIGNSVAPPVAYHLALAVGAALTRANF